MKNYIKSSRSYILSEIDDNVLEEVGELVAAGVVDFVIEKNGILRKYCGKAREVTVPEIVTSIGSEAFTECPTVEKVIIPKSVKIIESWAFFGCTSLNEVVLPEKLQKIEENAFRNCGLCHISISNSVKEIGDHCFALCNINELNHPLLKIENGLAIKDNRLLYLADKSLKNIVIPETVEIISSKAFEQCREIESVTIPNSVKSIEDFAFWLCDNLKLVKLPEDIKISDSAFCNCSKLELVRIPRKNKNNENVENIEKTDIENDFKDKIYDFFDYSLDQRLPSGADGFNLTERRIIFELSRIRREEVACIDLITQIRARMRNKIDACICKMASSSNIRYPILQGEGNFGDGFSGNHARNLDDRTVFKIEKNSPFFSNDYKNNAICNYSKKKWIFDEMDNCNYKMGEWSFVGRDEEPFGLNIVFPVLLCNGYSDYAPNCSWNYYKPSLEKIILPHNIINVTDSIKAVIENPNISDGELMKIIVGPDFPSGGVVNSKELEEIYKTGQGNLTVYAKIDVEYRRINIYLPFHVTVNDYWNEVFSKNIGIKTGEVYRNPNRIVIKVSENEDIDEVLSKLKQLKSLKKTFRVENKVLMDFEPKILNLRQMIDLYINNRYKALRGSGNKTKQKIISQLEELCIEFGDARRTEIKEF